MSPEQQRVLIAIAKNAKAKKGIKRRYARPPDVPIVQEIVKQLLQDGLVKPIKPYSKVVRLTNLGKTALEAIRDDRWSGQ